MHSTIALEPHSRPMRSTTSTAGPKDAPPPPTAEALTSPRRPFSRSARNVAAGKAASASTAAACSPATAATESSFDGSIFVEPIGLASEGAVEDQVHAAIHDIVVAGRVAVPVDVLEPQREVLVELPLDAGEPELLLDVDVGVVAEAVVRAEGPVAAHDLRARHQPVDVVGGRAHHGEVLDVVAVLVRVVTEHRDRPARDRR